MSGASSARQALHEEFVRETRALMLRRARVGILLGSGISLVLIFFDATQMAPDRFAEAAAVRATGVVMLLAFSVNFLDASKIEADRFILRTRRIDLSELVQTVLAEQSPAAEHKGIELLHDSAAELPHVDADAAALGRVLANLIGNAIKHTRAGGTVRVVARLSAAKEAEITVEDTGEGIPPGQESRIFERYTDAASRADSTGLGLFIARTLTNAHGGTIRAENRQDRAGARFIVALPAAAAKQ